MIFESFSLDFPDSITDQVLFFRNGSDAPGWLIANTAEVILLFALASIALRRMSIGRQPFVVGPMFWAVGLYTLMVVYGLVYGLGTGGNLHAGLWEARAQLYLFLLYLLVVNVIENRDQIVKIFWVFLLGISFKGLLGLWRLLVTLEGDVDNLDKLEEVSSNSIMAHEESFLFALFLVFLLMLWLFRGHRGQFGVMVLGAVPVIVMLLANERRMGSLSLIMGIVVILSLAYVFVPNRRTLIMRFAIVVALITPMYMAATWNTTGVFAEPTRAVKSLIQPNERDDSSNNYREIESRNIRYNIENNPILGRGYGKGIVFYDTLPFIPGFVWWDMIPHNTILWVWMRLGFSGFLAFWFLVGRFLIGTMIEARQLSDRYLKGLAVFATTAMVTWLFVGLVDMGLVDFRGAILIGTLMGLIGRLKGLQRPETEGDRKLIKPVPQQA